MGMKILVVGSGGREHALCWRVRADRPDADLYCAPGNSAIAGIATTVPLAADDIPGLVDWSVANRPDLVIVGPEDPCALGLVDRLAEAGIRAFGPSAAATRWSPVKPGPPNSWTGPASPSPTPPSSTPRPTPTTSLTTPSTHSSSRPTASPSARASWFATPRTRPTPPLTPSWSNANSATPAPPS